MASIMTIMLFSLASVPPMAGFFAKWYAFSAAVYAGLVPLVVVGMIASVISAFYYLRVIKIMWFDEAQQSLFLPLTGELKFVLTISGIFVLFYVFFGSCLFQLAEKAAASLF